MRFGPHKILLAALAAALLSLSPLASAEPEDGTPQLENIRKIPNVKIDFEDFDSLDGDSPKTDGLIRSPNETGNEGLEHAGEWAEIGRRKFKTYTVNVIGANRIWDPQRFACPDGHGVIEINLKAGVLVDAIVSLVCRNMKTGAEVTKLVEYGTSGGRPVSFRAPDKFVMTGFSLKLAERAFLGKADRKTPHQLLGAISEFVPHVRSVIDTELGPEGEHSFQAAGRGDARKSWIPADCPDGFYMKGVYIVGDSMNKHTGYSMYDVEGTLNAIGLHCEELKASAPPRGTLGPAGEEYGPGGATGLGGVSGSYFRADCPANQVVVGLTGSSGNRVDRIDEIACMPASNVLNKTLGIITKVPVVGAGGPGGTPKSIGYKHITGFGGWVENLGTDSEPRTILTRIVPIHFDDKFHILEEFGSLSIELNPNLPALGSLRGIEQKSLSCMSGLMTGIKGLAGQYVDSIGAICLYENR